MPTQLLAPQKAPMEVTCLPIKRIKSNDGKRTNDHFPFVENNNIQLEI